MPFEFCKDPGTFQRTTKVVVSAVKWKFDLVYLDKIIVFLESLEEHISHVYNVLSLLSDADFILNFKKRHFSAETIDYLGHVIYSRRLGVMSHTADAIHKLRLPTSFAELRTIVGL